MHTSSAPHRTLAARLDDRWRPAGSLLLSERLAHWARVRGDRPAITFVDHSTSRAGTPTTLTYRELDRRVGATAALVARHARGRDRVAVLAPQGLDFVVGFLAALRAGVVAVPLFPPDLPGHGDRLLAVLADCAPTLLLATRANADACGALLADRVPVLALDEIDANGGDRLPGPVAAVDADAVAYLQYTSGSTRTPAGVEITHANVTLDAAQAIHALGAPERTVVVSWLPLFHDMGLLFGLGGVLVGGFPSVVLDPVAFLMKPARWLHHLSAPQLPPGTYGVTAAPNFAYDYAAKRVTEQERAALDLSGVRVMVDGAEPIQPASLERFAATFASCGLAPDVLVPSYGLAEATVYVCGGQRAGGPVTTPFDAVELSVGRAVADPAPDAPQQVLVSCGRPTGQLLAIADPLTGVRLPADRVGEIWVHGPNVGRGYWRDPAASSRVFGQTLLAAGDLPEGPWLRTGDLGILHDGDLYVTGRLKDVMIVDGRNHYPQDVEHTVEAAHEAVARHRTAAFAVPVPGGEGVAVLAEISRHWVGRDVDPAAVRRAVRAAVSSRHGLSLVDVVLLEPDEVPRTTSGKIARAAARGRYLERGE